MEQLLQGCEEKPGTSEMESAYEAGGTHPPSQLNHLKRFREPRLFQKCWFNLASR